MGFSNPSRYNNKSRAYKSKRAVSSNQKRVNWAKKSSKRSKSASSQARQINAIAKTVDNLDTKLNPRTGKFTLAQGLYLSTGSIRIGYSVLLGTSPTQVFPLMPANTVSTALPTYYPQWSRWGPGVSASTNVSNPTSFQISEVSTCQRAKVGTMKLELAFSANTEPSPIQITVQVVTFADEESATYITSQYGLGLQDFPVPDATGEMAIRGPTAVFPAPSLGGCISLNPAYFRVLKEQRFVLANDTYTSNATDVTTAKDTYKSISWNIPMGNVLNSRDRGNWTLESADQGYGIANRRFLFITSDNANEDLEAPSMSLFASCIMSGQK